MVVNDVLIVVLFVCNGKPEIVFIRTMDFCKTLVCIHPLGVQK